MYRAPQRFPCDSASSRGEAPQALRRGTSWGRPRRLHSGRRDSSRLRQQFWRFRHGLRLRDERAIKLELDLMWVKQNSIGGPATTAALASAPRPRCATRTSRRQGTMAGVVMVGKGEYNSASSGQTRSLMDMLPSIVECARHRQGPIAIADYGCSQVRVWWGNPGPRRSYNNCAREGRLMPCSSRLFPLVPIATWYCFWLTNRATIGTRFARYSANGLWSRLHRHASCRLATSLPPFRTHQQRQSGCSYAGYRSTNRCCLLEPSTLRFQEQRFTGCQPDRALGQRTVSWVGYRSETCQPNFAATPRNRLLTTGNAFWVIAIEN